MRCQGAGNACALHRVKRGPDRASANGREQEPRQGAERRARCDQRAPHPMMRPMHLRLSALCLPLFFWRQKLRGFGRQNSDADASRERDRFSFRPRDSGGGGPLELAQRANRSGGGAGLGASFSVQPDYSRGAASFTRKETSKLDDNARRLLSCSVKCCAPSTTPSGTADASRRRSLRKERRPKAAYAPSPAIAVADGDYARVAAPDSITLLCPRTCHGIVRRFAGLAS